MEDRCVFRTRANRHVSARSSPQMSTMRSDPGASRTNVDRQQVLVRHNAGASPLTTQRSGSPLPKRWISLAIISAPWRRVS